MARMPDDLGTGEKSEIAAHGATSTPVNGRKHRLAHKHGLVRDILLHSGRIGETARFFQCYLVIAVIIESYEPLGREGMTSLWPTFRVPSFAIWLAFAKLFTLNL